MQYRSRGLLTALVVGATAFTALGFTAFRAAFVDETFCEVCEEGYWACWAVTDVQCAPGHEWTPIYAHRFTGEKCGEGGGGNFTGSGSMGDPEPVGCRACGWTSECHSDPQNGPCHEPCPGDCEPEDPECEPCDPEDPECPETLAGLSDAVGNLVLQLASENGENGAVLLAQAVSADERLTYSNDQNAIQLIGCNGTVLARWILSDDARAFFSPATQ